MIEIDGDGPPVTPRDAATVLLLRDAPGAAGFEVFLVRRHARSGFMAGAYVFPGGKLDDADDAEVARGRVTGRSPDDAAQALGEGGDAPALALFVAAIRETFEEARVLLADVPGDHDLGAAWRRMRDGARFGEILEALDATLRLDHMVPYARWITPAVERRRYDTRFFVAHAPPGQSAWHDEHETTDNAWLSPAGALSAMERGEIQLPPPTMRTMEMLAVHDRAEDVLRWARSHPTPLVAPVFEMDGGVPTLALPGDPLHPEADRVIPGGTRFVLADGRWISRDA